MRICLVYPIGFFVYSCINTTFKNYYSFIRNIDTKESNISDLLLYFWEFFPPKNCLDSSWPFAVLCKILKSILAVSTENLLEFYTALNLICRDLSIYRELNLEHCHLNNIHLPIYEHLFKS